VDYDSIKKTEDIVATYSKHIVNGYCHICKCDRRLLIDPDLSWSNTYACFMCGTGARTRGFIMVLDFYFSDYKHSLVHESGVLGVVSNHIANASAFYSSSEWDYSVLPGTILSDNHSNQNLEQLTFDDNTFDYFITQDVFEHINYPEKAAKEIMRVLKPGGKHVFTTPRVILKLKESRPRIKIENGEIIHLEPPAYHSRNNTAANDWLVTHDYGDDFLDLMYRWTNNRTNLYIMQELPGPDRFIEVFVTTKT
jgi:SAM-dependent methyltransferase